MLNLSSKEYLEYLTNKIRYKKEYIGDDTYRLYIKKNDIEFLEKALQRPKAIDNSNPSEAMNCINYIENKLDTLKHEYKSHLNHRCDDLFIQKDIFTTIKQYILKAKEQEKALKIIFKKYVDLDLLDCVDDVGQYNRHFGKDRQLTEEEFDSLKEMFRDV